LGFSRYLHNVESQFNKTSTRHSERSPRSEESLFDSTRLDTQSKCSIVPAELVRPFLFHPELRRARNSHRAGSHSEGPRHECNHSSTRWNYSHPTTCHPEPAPSAGEGSQPPRLASELRCLRGISAHSAASLSPSHHSSPTFFLQFSSFFLTTPLVEVYSYFRSDFSLMSASSELEPHPSLTRLRVRLSLAGLVFSPAPTLVVRPFVSFGPHRGRSRSIRWGVLTPG
jgi:hypothetical protein